MAVREKVGAAAGPFGAVRGPVSIDSFRGRTLGIAIRGAEAGGG
jgi:hypothetical protein